MKTLIPNKNVSVSQMGMGCWAIGGHFTLNGKSDGWGQIDDNESIKAIEKALDYGINFFDTADVYGTGHSEEVLSEALANHRDDVIIATKFGFMYNTTNRSVQETNVSPSYIKWACDQSLKRLKTDYIDLYQLHCYPNEDEIIPILDTLDELVRKGKILSYGPSTDCIHLAKKFTQRANCISVQYLLNVLSRNPDLQELCKSNNLKGIVRTPLAHGFLSGKFNADSFISKDDFRGAGHEWVAYFENGRPKPDFLRKLSSISEILTNNGRSMVQGALAWIWAENPENLPITGFKSVKQVTENAKAIEFGPLSQEDFDQINSILDAE
jgi:aryl-alcohol dehydrogenase-like predicted oxidoreductase